MRWACANQAPRSLGRGHPAQRSGHGTLAYAWNLDCLIVLVRQRDKDGEEQSDDARFWIRIAVMAGALVLAVLFGPYVIAWWLGH